MQPIPVLDLFPVFSSFSLIVRNGSNDSDMTHGKWVFTSTPRAHHAQPSLTNEMMLCRLTKINPKAHISTPSTTITDVSRNTTHKPTSSLVILVSASAAMAFGPASRTPRASSSLKMNFAEGLPGSTAPLGFFDPLGYSNNPEGEILRFREAEIKHGRVAMLAAVGILVGEAVEFNTPLFGDKIVGPAIYQFQEADQITGFGFASFIVGLIAAVESYGITKGWKRGSGDLGFDPLGFKPSDPEALATMQTKVRRRRRGGGGWEGGGGEGEGGGGGEGEDAKCFVAHTLIAHIKHTHYLYRKLTTAA